MPLSKDDMYQKAVMLYLNANKSTLTPPYNYTQIKSTVLETTQDVFTSQNQILPKNARVKLPDQLSNIQIAILIQNLEPIACISCDKDPDGRAEFDLIGLYQTEGFNRGIYDTGDRLLERLIQTYNWSASRKDMEEIKTMLRRNLPRRRRCMDPDLIAVNNGIFNYRTKQLHDFDPDKIFLSKSRVDYNPNAQNVTIHNPDDNTDWDVESWMASLSDDPEIVKLLWEVMGAIIRPFVPWDKSAWFYSHSGNSGKGTLCELMRNLCGRARYASIPLADFGKDFQLEPLINANAIIVDENDVGVYLDRVANLKAIITNDVILINRKFKTPVAYQFFGFMVQCLNEYPRIGDTSDSFYRRQLFIPFDKCFTGCARKYIKADYLSRAEVLEYVLYKVLNMNYYELSEPDSCKAVLDDFREFNSPIQSFMADFMSEFQWDLLPFTFLYDLYKEWFAQNSPSGRPQGRNTFIKDLADMAETGKFPGWNCPDRKTPIRTKGLMSKPEPLILQYTLKRWMNPSYIGKDQTAICTPALKASYRGLVRCQGTAQANEEPVDGGQLASGSTETGQGLESWEASA